MGQGRERLYRTEAVVLRRQDMGEADRLLTLYTPVWGKLRVVAKGVRKPASRKAGHVELFMHSSLLIAKFETTQIEWESVMELNPSKHIGTTLPVEQISWHACGELCRKTRL